MRTGELTQMVLDHYGAKENGSAKYIGLTQVRAATGWADPSTADVMVMGNWPSAGAKLFGFEVKISRADWLNELKNPGKATPTKKYCNKWWLAIVDKDFVKDGELPEDWGMMAVVDGVLTVIKQAPDLTPEPLSHLFVASLLRSNSKETIPVDVHEDKIKDLRREYEAAYKKEYTGLLAFIKEIHAELGIKIEHDSYQKSWYAQIGNWEMNKLVANGNHRLTPVQLAAAVKIALNGDMRTIKWELESVASAAQKDN